MQSDGCTQRYRQPIRTRKRTLAATKAPNRPATVAVTRHSPRLSHPSALDLPGAQLQQQGFARIPLPGDTQRTVAVAASAFQAQLRVWNKQPAQSRQAGFKAFPRKQRLEFRHGDNELGQLRSLQQLAVDVRLTAILHPACGCVYDHLAQLVVKACR